MSLENTTDETSDGLFRVDLWDILEAAGDTIDRIALVAILFVFLLMHILAFNEFLSEAEAADLQSWLQVGGVTIGMFEAIGYMLLVWAFVPIITLSVSEIVLRLRGGSE